MTRQVPRVLAAIAAVALALCLSGLPAHAAAVPGGGWHGSTEQPPAIPATPTASPATVSPTRTDVGPSNGRRNNRTALVTFGLITGALVIVSVVVVVTGRRSRRR